MYRVHAEISRVVNRLKNLEQESEYYEELLANGVPQPDLDQFLREGNSLKSPGSEKQDFKQDIEFLFVLSGWVAGGGALSHIFKTHRAPDYDVFFSDPLIYARAMIAMRRSPGIDVCYSPGKPYMAFDLAVAKCSFKRDEFDIDESCLEAIESGVSDICPDAIISADTTLGRMLKYNRYFGIRFKREQVLAMCSVFPVDKILAKKVILEVT